MPSYDDARAALLRVLRRVYPDAAPVRPWAGVEAWGASRPERAVERGSSGTYDPARLVVGIADRKAGPTIYFLDPGDFFALETHRELLEGAGLKLGRGCIYASRAAPVPEAALEELLRRTKARDARLAKASRAPAKAAAPGEPPAEVARYLAALPAPQRAALERLRAQVLRVVPAVERISYGIPTFVHRGRNLVHMAAFREHCSFFPGRLVGDLLTSEEKKRFPTMKGTIRFAPAKPLPAKLVQRIVRARVAQVEARASRKAGPPARRAAKAGTRRRPPAGRAGRPRG